jgi:ABC-2 type transport system ATP-binding protein
MTEFAVDTHNLWKQFGDHVAVADLSLAIPRGEVFGFLGPNGAGKTTSIKMLLGLTPPSGGSGTVLGSPIGDRPTRARIGFLPEHFRFHECLTGREFLRFHARLYKMDDRAVPGRIEELLRRLDLAEAGDRRLGSYSKGMQQRIGLAQALLNQPDLVLLDEPTSGLDPVGRLLVRDLIRELRARGATVFLNSHLLGEVEATCDRVVFVKHGQTISELDLASMDREMDLCLRLGRVDPTTLNRIGDFGRDAVCVDGVVHLHVDREQIVPQLVAALVQDRVEVYEVRVKRPSLEDIFLSVMGEDARPG